MAEVIAIIIPKGIECIIVESLFISELPCHIVKYRSGGGGEAATAMVSDADLAVVQINSVRTHVHDNRLTAFYENNRKN